MSQTTIVPWLVMVILGALLVSGASAAAINAAFVYGHPPSAGKIVLNFDNTANELDAVVIVTLGGNSAPLYAIYVPAEEIGSIASIGQGRYEIFYQLGIDWDEPNRVFQDGQFFKITTPVILTDNKDVYTVYLFDQEGKPKRTKSVTKKELPDIRPRI